MYPSEAENPRIASDWKPTQRKQAPHMYTVVGQGWWVALWQCFLCGFRSELLRLGCARSRQWSSLSQNRVFYKELEGGAGKIVDVNMILLA